MYKGVPSTSDQRTDKNIVLRSDANATNHGGCGLHIGQWGRTSTIQRRANRMSSYYIHRQMREEDKTSKEKAQNDLRIHTYNASRRNTSLYIDWGQHSVYRKTKAKHSNTIYEVIMQNGWAYSLIMVISLSLLFIYSSSWCSVCRSGALTQSVPALIRV